MTRLLLPAGVAAGLIFGLLIHPLLFHADITPVFSPEDGQEIIDLLDGASVSVDMEMYVLSSRDVVEALESAKDRGVDVRIIIERDVVGGENDAIFRELSAKGFRIRYASESFKLTHSKFVIVDGTVLLVGSHNLSNSALFKNREASVIIRDGPTIADFSRVFENDWGIAA